ncbi:hypothetical protein DQW77_13120 [Roseovarius sp. TE539]|uniref:hypothetical protein n=1 Tax=Roseovarius sp. TE539 TaxID=2249812 RepID=UPI000DDD49F7|nr:hypothetical protein [Roseovarius sp. TE539]RBI70889.1 hypothetical protein DQW77_13120 [Roseovarius sp. TE539]
MDDPDPEVFFAAGGKTYGTAGEMLGFYAILLLLMLRAGYDAVTGVAIILRDFGTGNATGIDRLTPDEAHKRDLPERSIGPHAFSQEKRKKPVIQQAEGKGHRLTFTGVSLTFSSRTGS